MSQRSSPAAAIARLPAHHLALRIQPDYERAAEGIVTIHVRRNDAPASREGTHAIKRFLAARGKQCGETIPRQTWRRRHQYPSNPKEAPW